MNDVKCRCQMCGKMAKVPEGFQASKMPCPYCGAANQVPAEEGAAGKPEEPLDVLPVTAEDRRDVRRSWTGVCCPQCQSPDFQAVTFTWWGGLLGPKLFNHVKCLDCGTKFNGKTGQSNTTAIVLYIVIANVIGIALLVFLFSLKRL